MPLTIVITRNTPARVGGFLSSCMQEVAPGVYISPRMKAAVRDRVWKVMMEWAQLIPDDGGVAMFWRSRSAPSGLALRFLGWPKRELLDYEGHWLGQQDFTTANDVEELLRLLETEEPMDDGGDPALPS